MPSKGMPTVPLLLCLCALVLLAPLGAQAKDKTLPPPQTGEQIAEPQKAEIVADKEAGIVRILIEGKEVVLIDSSGIQVFGDVRYSGVWRDTNGQEAESKPASGNKP